MRKIIAEPGIFTYRTAGSVASWGQMLQPIIQAGFLRIRGTDFLANTISGYSPASAIDIGVEHA
jgi:hypothetical protein